MPDPHHQAFVLGTAPDPTPVLPFPPDQPRELSSFELEALANAPRRVPATLGGGGIGVGLGEPSVALGLNEGGRYISQVWEDGTVCDMTGLKRRTEVQFHCSTQSVDRIVMIRETAICVYSLVIHTVRPCHSSCLTLIFNGATS